VVAARQQQLRKTFLHNFYLKSRRSIEKPTLSGPAAYVFPADDAHHSAQSQLLRILQLQHIEVSRATDAFTVLVPSTRDKSTDKPKSDDDEKDDAAQETKPKAVPRSFPAGSFVVRMDQPYSRIADTLLDRQYWAPEDPQKHPYDDTGWTMQYMRNVKLTALTESAGRVLLPANTAIAPPKSAVLFRNSL